MTRIQEYAVIGAAAVAAGLVGVAIDQVTVTVSPEYFVIGKGLGAEPSRLEVAWLGFRSGLPVGGALAGAWLLRRRDRRPPWGRAVRMTLASMIASALVFGVVAAAFDPLGARSAIGALMSPSRATAYVATLGIHFGVYVGAVVGGVVAARRGRP